MRDRHSSSPATDRSTSIQPAVAANGACWRRQAVSVVSGTCTDTAAVTPRDGTPNTTEPCGDGRFPIQEKR